jgi:hypothetical protein
MTMRATIGAGWRKGNPIEAKRILEAMQPPLTKAWLATAAETNSFELIGVARRWLPLRETFAEPRLDECHVYEEVLALRAVLEGARSVPDACEEAKPFIAEALKLLAGIWEQLDWSAPIAPQSSTDPRWRGPQTTEENFFAGELTA